MWLSVIAGGLDTPNITAELVVSVVLLWASRDFVCYTSCKIQALRQEGAEVIRLTEDSNRIGQKRPGLALE